MIQITPLPSIDDKDISIHTPKWYNRIIWKHGYVDYDGNPIARKSRIFNIVQVRYYNDLFHYWCWCAINDKYKSSFVVKRYW